MTASLPSSLPKAVAAYVAGTNAHEPETIVRAFSEDGVVHDEHKVHRGSAAIAEWAHDTVNKYRMTMMPLSVKEAAGAVVIRAKVSGTFPGSPVELIFNFEVGEAGIRSLEIGA